MHFSASRNATRTLLILVAGGVTFTAAARLSNATPSSNPQWFLHALRSMLLTEMPPLSTSPTSPTDVPASWASPRADDHIPAVIAHRVLAVLRDMGFTAVIEHYAAATLASGDESSVRLLLALMDAAEAAIAFDSSPLPARDSSMRNATIVGTPITILASDIPLEYAGASVSFRRYPHTVRLCTQFHAQFALILQLAVGDFNADGSDDVAIGAWGHSLNPLPSSEADGGSRAGLSAPRMLMQSGALYTQYGNASVIGAAVGPRSVAPAPIPLPDAPTYGVEMYARLGWSTCALDFNAGGNGQRRHYCAYLSSLDDDSACAPATRLFQMALMTSPPQRLRKTGTLLCHP
jgi:hypothetical protein